MKYYKTIKKIKKKGTNHLICYMKVYVSLVEVDHHNID